MRDFDILALFEEHRDKTIFDESGEPYAVICGYDPEETDVNCTLIARRFNERGWDFIFDHEIILDHNNGDTYTYVSTEELENAKML